MSEDIDKIDLEIEEEARKCLKNFSELNCPLENMEDTGKCKSLYECARKTRSSEHIKTFLEKAAYMAIFEVTTEAMGPILIIAVIIALKLLQKFE